MNPSETAGLVLAHLRASNAGLSSGELYALAEMPGLDDWHILLDVMQDMGMIIVDGTHLVTLTPKGQNCLSEV